MNKIKLSPVSFPYVSGKVAWYSLQKLSNKARATPTALYQRKLSAKAPAGVRYFRFAVSPYIVHRGQGC